jgi:hypothetical protein
MVHSHCKFNVTHNVRVHADPSHKGAILLSFKTSDGKLLELEMDYQTTIKIHDRIGKLMQDFWETR